MANNIIIVGAGLVGSLLSILLSKKGFNVTIYEKRGDSRQSGAERGRSINLALSRRGILALKAAGIEAKIKAMALPMAGRMMHDLKGNLTFLPYGKEGQEIYSISRLHLNELLMDKAEEAGVKVYFKNRCIDIDIENSCLHAENESLGITHATADLIFGTDGAFSAVREALRKTDRFNYSQFYVEYGYKELSIPPTPNGDFALSPNALHIWPRGRFMLIALPNLDKSFTCTLFLPFEGEQSFEALRNKQQVIDFFTKEFPDAARLMPALARDFFDNPTGSLVTISCFPWVKDNKIALLGDAAHALVPFYGQGMNAGFEDCRILDNLIEAHEGDWRKIFRRFQSLRKPDADAISALALQNFIEMRDLVSDPKFLLRKKIEAKLHELYPEKWIPLYAMVTFSDMRYSEALEIGRKQDKIMQEVMEIPDIEHQWQKLNFEKYVRKLKEDAV